MTKVMCLDFEKLPVNHVTASRSEKRMYKYTATFLLFVLLLLGIMDDAGITCIWVQFLTVVASPRLD